MNHGTLYGYEKRGCRCDACRARYSEWKNGYNHRTGRRDPARNPATAYGLPDDGYIDPIAVERLLAGTLHWLDATQSEREEAGRIALARGDGGWRFCAEVLHLGPSVMRRIRREVAA